MLLSAFSPLLLSLTVGAPFGCEPAIVAAPSWRAGEEGLLANQVQLTSSEQFRKAGECYFSPDGKQVIFQGIERMDRPEDEESFYQMYVADLTFDGGRVTGIENVLRLSPPGSSNTCGWFHPTEPGVVVFGSTVVKPVNPDQAGYQRDTSRYRWQFPQEMDIVRCELAKADATAATLERLVADPEAYLAECVISADGKRMVFCEHRVAEGRSGGDLFVLDFETGERVVVTGSDGYDGGPFFSPDGRRICYRSDRDGDDLLQIFVSELRFGAGGKLLGVGREFQLTDNGHVNWAPFWHPNGRFLIYATSEMGHENYEVFVIDADPGVDGDPTKYGTRRRRITHAPKFDGLPVFNHDASRMMWTSQRGEDKSSQVWLADFIMDLDGGEAAVEEGQAEASAEPERLQVRDPESGLIYLYDTAAHKLSVYNPKTHKVREDLEEAEVARAMELFQAADTAE